MPTELGNLLIRVTSVGFDEVLRNLGELESALGRVGANSSLGRISQQLDQMSRYMRDMHGDLGRLTILQEQNASQMSKQGKQAQEASDQLSKFDKTLQGIAKTYTLVMTAVAVGRKFKNSIEQIASFNLAVSNMAMNANMARGSLMELGAIAQGLGGSRQGVAALGSRFQTDMMNLRMGRGGGATLDVATTYGLSLRGSGHGGMATPEEMMRNVAELFERMGNSELAKLQKLDIKRMLGMDDGTFKMLDKGVKAYDESLKKAAADQKEMASAVAFSAEVSQDLADIEKEWHNAQLKMLEAMAPLVKQLLKWYKEIVGWIKQNPTKSGIVATGLGLVGAGGTAWAIVRKLFGGGGSSGSAGAATNAASGAAGGAGAVGRAAGSLSGAAGAAGSIATAGLQALQIWKDTWSYDSKNKVETSRWKSLTDIVKDWHDQWYVVTFAKYAKKEHLEFYQDYLTKNRGHKMTGSDLVLAALEDKIGTLNARYSSLNDVKGKTDEKDSPRPSITISEIRIEVNSNSANADEVAKAVREELFKQINASIDDAIIKGRVL